MQHGQKITGLPKQLLAQAGFTVKDPPEGHLCCGSAGTYNLLQPEIAGRLRDRKVANIESTGPQVIATGNIGCITQIASGTAIPVVHTVELLDWATGGPRPRALAARCEQSVTRCHETARCLPCPLREADRVDAHRRTGHVLHCNRTLVWNDRSQAGWSMIGP